MRKAISIFFAVAAVIASGATKPSLEISATSTNLIVTEQAQVSFVLRLPPVPGEYANAQPPFLNQRPPHFSCSFLEPNWKSDVLDRGDVRAPLSPAQMPQRGRRPGPAFTLNKYVSDSIFSALDDPFSMFEDMDPFARMGPKPQLFPFTVAREADKGWRFTAAVAPWRMTSAGTVRLDPVTVEVPLITGVRRGRDRFNRAVDVPVFSNVVLRTKPFVITVSEPPVEGRPASWCGAIASNLSVTASLDAKVCTAGDPLTLTMEIAGAANAASVHPPDFSFVATGSVFRVDVASAKTETIGTTRRFTWRVRPLKAGTVEFPSLPVSYYDVGSRKYVTRNTDSIPIQVKAGAQAALGVLDEKGDETDEFPMPDGIDLDPSGAAALPLLPHALLALLLFVVPPFLFLAIRMAPPVRRYLASRNEAYRRSHAFGVCRRALKSRNGEKRAAAIRRFFTVRYGINGASVTASDAQRLMQNDYAEEDVALIVTSLQAHDAQTYSAKPGAGAVAILLVAGLSLASSAAAPDAPPPSRADFSYRRASSLAVRAKDENEAEFKAAVKAAADAYKACIDAGAGNAALYQNLGACFLMAGDARGAWAAYSCAERRGGATPSTTRGLQAALAHIKSNPRAELPMTRVFFRPHYAWPVDVRLLCAAAVWAALWLVALLPVGALRRFLMTVGLIAFCAFALSTGVSLVGEHLDREVFNVQG